MVLWEPEPNRLARPVGRHSGSYLVVANGGHFRYPPSVDREWRGAGVVAPIFSLRTASSLGVGDFVDVCSLVDFCVATKLRMFQVCSCDGSRRHRVAVALRRHPGL